MADAKKYSDIDAHMRQIEAEKNNANGQNGNGNGNAEDRVRLDGGGYYDTDIYESRGNKYTHYNQSIPIDDKEDDEDDTMPVLGRKSNPSSSFFMKETIEKDHDPMAQYKKPTVADREDDYRARFRNQKLSPDRVDPFMDDSLPLLHIATMSLSLSSY